MDTSDGREAWVTVSLAMEAKHRSIAAVMVADELEMCSGKLLSQDVPAA